MFILSHFQAKKLSSIWRPSNNMDYIQKQLCWADRKIGSEDFCVSVTIKIGDVAWLSMRHTLWVMKLWIMKIPVLKLLVFINLSFWPLIDQSVWPWVVVKIFLSDPGIHYVGIALTSLEIIIFNHQLLLYSHNFITDVSMIF